MEDGYFVETCRVVRGIDITKDDKTDWLISLFTEAVLMRPPCLVRVEKWPKQDEVFKAWVRELTALSSVFQ